MNLTEAVKAAGIVGAGGAGFPTHVKLNAKAECFVVNAAECEPLIETDKSVPHLCGRDHRRSGRRGHPSGGRTGGDRIERKV